MNFSYQDRKFQTENYQFHFLIGLVFEPYMVHKLSDTYLCMGDRVFRLQVKWGFDSSKSKIVDSEPIENVLSLQKERKMKIVSALFKILKFVKAFLNIYIGLGGPNILSNTGQTILLSMFQYETPISMSLFYTSLVLSPPTIKFKWPTQS